MLRLEKGVTQVFGQKARATRTACIFPRLSYYPDIPHAFLVELEPALFEEGQEH